MSAIEESFHNDMFAIYEKSGRSVGYWPHRFLQKVKRSGGIASAKYWLLKPGVSEGFKRLAKEKKLELAMENLILRPEYKELFSEDDRAVARRRLTEYGFF